MVLFYLSSGVALNFRCTRQGFLETCEKAVFLLHPDRSQIQQQTIVFNPSHNRDGCGTKTVITSYSIHYTKLYDTLEAFKASGVFHILAISGLHFSLLGLFSLGAWLFILKRSEWLLIHTHVPSLALLMTAPILLFYAFVAGLNLPAMRALITALLVLFAVLARRQRSFLPLIAAAALLIFALNPLAVFTPSFQLSFAAVLATT